MDFINNFNLATRKRPFGGVKASGHGRVYDGVGMSEFVDIEAITLPGKAA